MVALCAPPPQTLADVFRQCWNEAVLRAELGLSQEEPRSSTQAHPLGLLSDLEKDMDSLLLLGKGENPHQGSRDGNRVKLDPAVNVLEPHEQNLQAHKYHRSFHSRLFQGIVSIGNVSLLSKARIHPRTPHFGRGKGQRGFLRLRIKGKIELTSCLLRAIHFTWIDKKF